MLDGIKTFLFYVRRPSRDERSIHNLLRFMEKNAYPASFNNWESKDIFSLRQSDFHRRIKQYQRRRFYFWFRRRYRAVENEERLYYGWNLRNYDERGNLL